MRTLIFVPTYNERHNAQRMAEELLALPLDADVLFIDDGSPDGTGDVLDALANREPRLSVIHRAGKLGIGSAHFEGISRAYSMGYERLVTLDCDFTHQPSDVMRLLDAGRGFDMATGSRYLAPGSLPGWNPVRRALTGIGHILTHGLLRIPHDATGALRVYDLRRIPRELFDLVQARGYGFFFESMFVLVRNGYTVAELPIVLPARTYGSSKMSARETFRSGFRLLSLWKESVVDPRRFLLSRRPPELDAALVDPQGWDGYWSVKTQSSTRLYEGIAGIYRALIIRAQLRRALIDTYDEGANLLHAGCGSGQVDDGMHSRFSITAVDISPAALELYARNNPGAFEIRHADILALPYPDHAFDGVYNLGVLEHFERDAIIAILREFKRVLKPSGRLLFFWPHARATSVAVLGAAHWLMKTSGSETRLHPPEVSLLQSRGWIEDILRDAGLRLRDYRFGPRDFFVQAVITAERDVAGQ